MAIRARAGTVKGTPNSEPNVRGERHQRSAQPMGKKILTICEGSLHQVRTSLLMAPMVAPENARLRQVWWALAVFPLDPRTMVRAAPGRTSSWLHTANKRAMITTRPVSAARTPSQLDREAASTATKAQLEGKIRIIEESTGGRPI